MARARETCVRGTLKLGRNLRRAAALTGAALFVIAPAIASETIAYQYDARGRLVQVNRTGTINNGVTACYAYDQADNRSNVTVVTSGNCATAPTTPSFSVGDATVTEGGTLAFTVTKTGPASSSFSVNYASANGTATAGSDYTAASGTLTFTSAQTSKTVNVATTDDAVVESVETMQLNLSGATGGATISDAAGSGIINDNDTATPPGFSIANTSVDEGGTLSFTVTKIGSASSSFSVNYATANGTAVAGSDYTSTSGTLTFTSAQTTKTVSVATTDDSLTEDPETVLVNLSGATGGATILDSQGEGTIYDNEQVVCYDDDGMVIACLIARPSDPTASEESTTSSADPPAEGATEPADAIQQPDQPEAAQ